jgi:hypothetical protein
MLVWNELRFYPIIRDVEAGTACLLGLRLGRQKQTEERKSGERKSAKANFRHKLQSVGNKFSAIYVNYTRSPLFRARV